MTHTLHRLGKYEDLSKDYIVFSMAAQKYNDKGAAKKLVQIFKLLLESDPVNYGDDNRGGVLTGVTASEIVEKAGDKAYMAAVYTNREALKETLRKLKEADIGMPVVVSGNFKEVFEVAREVGLKPHTVHLSLGVYGKKELLPKEEILEITTMCGHGMVCPSHVERIIDKVRKGKMTSTEAGIELAKPCTCAMFNPVRATEIIERICSSEREDD
jgi:hypothetical protein